MIVPILLDGSRRCYSFMDAAIDGEAQALSITIVAATPLHKSGQEYTPAGEKHLIQVTLEALRYRRDFWDGVIYGITVVGGIVPLRGETLNNREQVIHYALRHHPEICGMILVPDTESVLEDCLITLFATPGVTLSETLAPLLVGYRQYNTLRTGFMPTFHFSGPGELPAGETGEFWLGLTSQGKPYNGIIDIYLETVNGILPKTRVRVSGDKPGSFKLLTFGLEPGDEVKLKAGFRNMPGKTEKIVRIV